MNKKFNAANEIELGLHHHVSHYYHLKYRFLPKKVKVRILWFYITVTIHDPWHVIYLYKSTGLAEINPDDEELWNAIRINITDTSDVQYYKGLKREIDTYKDLDEHFNLTIREKKYEIDKSTYKLANSK